MSQLRDKCNELIERYEQFIAKGGPKKVTSQEKIDYINNQYNAINLINKLICISSTGQDPDQATVAQDSYTKAKNMAENLFRDKPVKKTVTESKPINKKPAIKETPVNEENKTETKKSTTKKKTTDKQPVDKTTTPAKKKTTDKQPVDKTTTPAKKKSTSTKKTTKTTEKATTTTTKSKKTTSAKKKSASTKKTQKEQPKKTVNNAGEEIFEMSADEFFGGGTIVAAAMADHEKLSQDEIDARAAKAKAEFDALDDNITAKDVIIEELGLWGISPESLGYKALVAMSEVDLKIEATYKEVVNAVAKKLNKPTSSVGSALSYVAKAADFKNSKYIPKFRKLVKLGRINEINRELIVAEFKEYCVEDEE
jgi:hypothetical protein